MKWKKSREGKVEGTTTKHRRGPNLFWCEGGLRESISSEVPCQAEFWNGRGTEERGESTVDRGTAKTLQLDGARRQPRNRKQAGLGAAAEGGDERMAGLKAKSRQELCRRDGGFQSFCLTQGEALKQESKMSYFGTPARMTPGRLLPFSLLCPQPRSLSWTPGQSRAG